MDLWVDYSCPHCQEYEDEVGDTFGDLIASGDVAIEFHPMRVVTDYGIRAGSAAACVAVGAPEQYLDVRADLFAVHDAETDGWSNEQLRDHLAASIDDQDVLDCIGEGRYAGWIGENTQAAIDAGVSATPTLWVDGALATVDGESVDRLTSAQLRALVAG